MFEEVPRRRSGLAGLIRRRIVLGPFVVGGGMLLATVGGSVAVAATVFTASNLHGSELPPKSLAQPPVVSSSPVSRHSVTPTKSSAHPVASASPSIDAKASSGRIPPSTAAATLSSVTSRPATVVGPTATGSGSPTAPNPSSAPTPTSTASVTAPANPVGNALVFFDGYDQGTGRLRFAYASVRTGAGLNNSDLYVADFRQHFTAFLAPTASITSGQLLCPPVGSHCTAAQLTQATNPGFFAEAAIAANGQVLSVVEVDNLGFGGAAPPPPGSSTPTPSPSGTPSPTGSASSSVPAPSAAPAGSNASPVG